MSFIESGAALRTPAPFVPAVAPAARVDGPLYLHRHDDFDRAAVEAFIAGVYRRHFAARLRDFMPVIVSRGDGESPAAAAGYRPATEPLFLERYLPRPVEAMLAQAAGQTVAREQIVEVGHFAAQQAGEGRRLMLALARHLVDAGFRWAVVTATAELRRLLGHLHLSGLPLGVARRHSVGADAPLWGSYYRHAPRVIAGDLLLSLACLERGRRPTMASNRA
jgi:hypothetical protein